MAVETELWSIKEKRVYNVENANQITVGSVRILCTPSKEPLVVRIR